MNNGLKYIFIESNGISKYKWYLEFEKFNPISKESIFYEQLDSDLFLNTTNLLDMNNNLRVLLFWRYGDQLPQIPPHQISHRNESTGK